MSTLNEETPGRWRVVFVARDGRRMTVRIGQVSRKNATHFQAMTDKLIDGQRTGRPDADAVEWAKSLDSTLRNRLVKVGLLDPHAGNDDCTLGRLLEAFMGSLTDVKGSTLKRYEWTRKALEAHFGKTMLVRNVTPHEAEVFRQTLKASGLAQPTIAKHVRTSKMIFRRAMLWRMAESNPFAGVKAGSEANRARQHFITAADAYKVLDSCPDTQTKLVFALARFGGLRTPSETLALRWTDVDWERSRLRIRSPKLEHVEGKAERVCPIFPELYPYLRQAFEEAEPGTTHVINLSRDATKNFRTRFKRYIRNAGLVPWPKTFHNCRSSRQSELSSRFPVRAVADWLGNSPHIAWDHYLQTTDADFAAAASTPTTTPAGTPLEKPARIPAQHRTETGGTGKQPRHTDPENLSETPGDSLVCVSVPSDAESTKYPQLGSNNPPETKGKPATSPATGTNSGTLPPGTPADSDLDRLIAAWPTLTPEARRQIMALIG